VELEGGQAACYLSLMKRKSDERVSPPHAETALGQKAFAAISAVEGLKLNRDGRKRVLTSAPTDQRRADVLRAYSEHKSRK
jgi:hypothetical protein